MVDRGSQVPVVRQCQLLELCRSGAYYEPMTAPAADLQMVRLVDEAHLQYCWYGSRNIVDWLRKRGVHVNRKRVQRLMRQAGIHSTAPQPRGKKAGKEHKIYPYLLRGLSIRRPNQVWAADITYIPMPRGWLYLVAIMDWHSRKVLAWRLSNTLDVDFCLEALREALATYGTPEILNTDQGTQFTSTAFTEALQKAGVRISMDGRGRWVDNVMIERVWRTLKYEEVYLKSYESVAEAHAGIGSFFRRYNQERGHSSLNRQTPDQVYYAGLAAVA